MPLSDIFAESVSKVTDKLDSTREKRDSFLEDIERQISENDIEEIVATNIDSGLDRGRKFISNAESAVSSYAQDLVDPRNLFQIVQGLGALGPFDLSIEHLAHWYMRADLERRLYGLIFKGFNSFLRGNYPFWAVLSQYSSAENKMHHKIEEIDWFHNFVYIDGTVDEYNTIPFRASLTQYSSIENKLHDKILKKIDKKPSLIDDLDSEDLEEEEVSLESIASENQGNNETYKGFNAFFTNIIQNDSGDSLFLLQHRYLFNVTMEFNGALTYAKYNDNIRANKLPHEVYTELVKFTKDGTFELLVRNAVLPNLNGDKAEKIINEFGYMSLASNRIVPDDNEFALYILNTEYSMLENLFYKWMLQTSSDRWHYEEQPFMTADITITYYDQTYNWAIYSYKFHKCFPRMITTMDPDHDAGQLDFSRNMIFSFDYMTIATEPHYTQTVIRR